MSSKKPKTTVPPGPTTTNGVGIKRLNRMAPMQKDPLTGWKCPLCTNQRELAPETWLKHMEAHAAAMKHAPSTASDGAKYISSLAYARIFSFYSRALRVRHTHPQFQELAKKIATVAAKFRPFVNWNAVLSRTSRPTSVSVSAGGRTISIGPKVSSQTQGSHAKDHSPNVSGLSVDSFADDVWNGKNKVVDTAAVENPSSAAGDTHKRLVEKEEVWAALAINSPVPRSPPEFPGVMPVNAVNHAITLSTVEFHTTQDILMDMNISKSATATTHQGPVMPQLVLSHINLPPGKNNDSDTETVQSEERTEKVIDSSADPVVPVAQEIMRDDLIPKDAYMECDGVAVSHVGSRGDKDVAQHVMDNAQPTAFTGKQSFSRYGQRRRGSRVSGRGISTGIRGVKTLYTSGLRYRRRFGLKQHSVRRKGKRRLPKTVTAPKCSTDDLSVLAQAAMSDMSFSVLVLHAPAPSKMMLLNPDSEGEELEFVLREGDERQEIACLDKEMLESYFNQRDDNTFECFHCTFTTLDKSDIYCHAADHMLNAVRDSVSLPEIQRNVQAPFGDFPSGREVEYDNGYDSEPDSDASDAADSPAISTPESVATARVTRKRGRPRKNALASSDASLTSLDAGPSGLQSESRDTSRSTRSSSLCSEDNSSMEMDDERVHTRSKQPKCPAGVKGNGKKTNATPYHNRSHALLYRVNGFSLYQSEYYKSRDGAALRGLDNPNSAVGLIWKREPASVREKWSRRAQRQTRLVNEIMHKKGFRQPFKDLAEDEKRMLVSAALRKMRKGSWATDDKRGSQLSTPTNRAGSSGSRGMPVSRETSVARSTRSQAVRKHEAVPIKVEPEDEVETGRKPLKRKADGRGIGKKKLATPSEKLDGQLYYISGYNLYQSEYYKHFRDTDVLNDYDNPGKALGDRWKQEEERFREKWRQRAQRQTAYVNEIMQEQGYRAFKDLTEVERDMLISAARSRMREGTRAGDEKAGHRGKREHRRPGRDYHCVGYSAYVRYVARTGEKFKGKGGMLKAIRTHWNAMPDAEKQSWEAKAKQREALVASIMAQRDIRKKWTQVSCEERKDIIQRADQMTEQIQAHFGGDAVADSPVMDDLQSTLCL
ncbi:uncharacterized protein LOC129584871 isoform X3 [Paramacrobiotus metropolitanus]|uniref:uncharacterized protein LOC129584871 isoform X3 n=1 Tax=Paramacrobiotus metropolitanus TaxID=2943436 RepID=UPI0024456A4F|nr:uncharacterized protein LOC129584871 isoform X3 [Paramacrobiotus metropolitanus]